jgi:CheY-like chemotaxis protein
VSRHVLLVDDDPDIRLVAGAALTQVAGWRVSEAASGPDGVETARQAPPDVVLLDLMMPAVDGRATLARFQADDRLRTVPVIVLTTTAAGVDTDDLLRLGARGVLAKPFDPFTLHRQVATILGWNDE